MQKAAEILVQCGYAIHMNLNDYRIVKAGGDWIEVEFEEDTLEGRRQAEAIEDWLYKNNFNLWSESKLKTRRYKVGSTPHQWRLECIKWCLEKL